VRWVLISSSFWFGVFVTTHWAFFSLRHIGNRASFLTQLFATSVVCQQLTVLALAFHYGIDLRILHWAAAGVLTMASLFVLYMPFYYTIATSLSVQSMIMVLKAGGKMPLQRLSDAFASRELIDGRLQTMRQSGYLVSLGDAFATTVRGDRMVSVFVLVKRIWKLGSGG
jgi:hypothetical protein